MSAEALALAVRAAAAYAGVRGRWSPLCRTIVIESDVIQPWRCSVRESPRGAGTLLFDPLPRKEILMPAAPPKASAPEGTFTVHATTRIGSESDRVGAVPVVSYQVHGSPAMVTVHLGIGSHLSTESPGWLRELGRLFTQAAEALEGDS